MDIPVYLITGFLDAGKTDFINGILKDGFAAEDRTLLLCCEEGETEYDPKALFNVFTYTVDDPAQLTPEFFKKLVENIVMWSFVIVIAALALTILGLPLYLALTVDWKFALIYLLYPVVLMVMAALAASRGGDGE